MRRVAIMLGCAGALAITLSASASADTTGSISNLRAAVSTVISAELDGDGATACGKLYAPLTTTVNGVTCAARWDARSKHLLAQPGGAARLRADLAAVPTASVKLDGPYATVGLPHPLLDGRTRFYWIDACWMLMR